MAKGTQDGLGDELFGTRLGEERGVAGPTKGEFVPPSDTSGTEEGHSLLQISKQAWYCEVSASSILLKLL